MTDEEVHLVEVSFPEQTPEMDQFALDLSHDLTILVRQHLEMFERQGMNAHAFRFAVMHAHLVGIAASIHACELLTDAEEMFVYFQAFGAQIVGKAMTDPNLWYGEDDGPMETHAN